MLTWMYWNEIVKRRQNKSVNSPVKGIIWQFIHWEREIQEEMIHKYSQLSQDWERNGERIKIKKLSERTLILSKVILPIMQIIKKQNINDIRHHLSSSIDDSRPRVECWITLWLWTIDSWNDRMINFPGLLKCQICSYKTVLLIEILISSD